MDTHLMHWTAMDMRIRPATAPWEQKHASTGPLQVP